MGNPATAFKIYRFIVGLAFFAGGVVFFALVREAAAGNLGVAPLWIARFLSFLEVLDSLFRVLPEPLNYVPVGGVTAVLLLLLTINPAKWLRAPGATVLAPIAYLLCYALLYAATPFLPVELQEPGTGGLAAWPTSIVFGVWSLILLMCAFAGFIMAVSEDSFPPKADQPTVTTSTSANEPQNTP